MRMLTARSVRQGWLICGIVLALLGGVPQSGPAAPAGQTIIGHVHSEDLRHVATVTVELRDQQGALVTSAVTNDRGGFTLHAPHDGEFSIQAVQDTRRSERLMITVGSEKIPLITLTMIEIPDVAQEITAQRLPTVEVVASRLPAREIDTSSLPINVHSSSETYSVSRRDIEALPRGNNLDLHDLLLTIPGAVYGSLKQVHIRQDHANLQFRIDGVPIPDTVTSQFSDLLSPRVWERADIILGGMEAQYGNRTAAVIDITSKSGTKPGFGSIGVFGGSNETVLPSFEYGGKAGDRFRFYMMNNYRTTNRAIDPPTLGQSIFHSHGETNQTFLRGDYQVNNRNNVTWLLLNSVASSQIPTQPGQKPNEEIVELIRDHTDPNFTPVTSEKIDENQDENNQYSHLVWRHEMDADRFVSVAGYFRHSRATFTTDPLNVLAYTSDDAEPFSAGHQDRWAYAGGIRLDYTHELNSRHLIKAGFQIDRTTTRNKTRLSVFARQEEEEDHEEEEEEEEEAHEHGHGAEPVGGVLARNADRRIIGYREEFWFQDQFTPNEHWTMNLGLRMDNIHGYVEAFQVSPRIGVTYTPNNQHAFHAFYGRLFTPPNLEALPFQILNLEGTTAQPEHLANVKTKPERSHYVEIGSTHALGKRTVIQVTGYYKFNTNQADAHQFNTTPMLNYFAFERGWQRGIDFSLKSNLTDTLTARGNVAWGQCKGYDLQSGHFLLHEPELVDIESRGGVFCDHSQDITSSAAVTYRPFPRTTITAQMLFGSGLRKAEPGQKTNSGHEDSNTTYNLSLTHVVPFTKKQKLLLAVDVVNLFDQQEFLNTGEQSVGLGVSHANMPRSVFFRTQWFF